MTSVEKRLIRLTLAELIAGHQILAITSDSGWSHSMILWDNPRYLPKPDKFIWRASTFSGSAKATTGKMLATKEEALTRQFDVLLRINDYYMYKNTPFVLRRQIAERFLDGIKTKTLQSFQAS